VPVISHIDIQCLHCTQWSPSPIEVPETEALRDACLFHVVIQCPYCCRLTPYTEGTVRLKLAV